MNTLYSFLKIYLQINLLLFSSCIIFIVLNRITNLTKLKTKYRHLVIWGQLLVLISIFAPLVFQYLPNKQLPKINFDVFSNEKNLTDTNFKKEPQQNLYKAKNVQNSEIINKQLLRFKNTDFNIVVIFLMLLGGFIFCLTRFLRNIVHLNRLLADSALIYKYKNIRVVASHLISIPFSVRLIKIKWIVLPISIFDKIDDLKFTVKHEFQHHRQGDTLWAVFVEILQSVFYINPFIYIWKKEITELQEFSCDDALIGRKGVLSHDYGCCLVRMAETAYTNRKMFAGTAGMATISNLRRRIEMVVNHKKIKTRKWVGVTIGCIVTLFTLSIGYAATQSMNKGTVTVDDTIQKITEKILFDAVKEENATAGFAIVADPNNGKILAVADIDIKNKRPKFWSLSYLVEPASLAKTLVAAEAIEKGLTTPDEKHNCEKGSYKYGDFIYHDWKEEGWDYLTTTETIANSGDICSIKIGDKIGAEGLVKMLNNFGFGPNGSAKYFPMAKPGQLPPPDDSKKRLVPYVSSGFGFLVSPIEMLQAYGAIANGGNLMLPKSFDDKDPNGKIIRRVLSPESAEKIKGILRSVVLNGTAKGRADSTLFTVAGKTATAFSKDLTQGDLMKGGKKADFASFIGFAPLVNPSIEVYVGIKDPHTDKSGAHGSVHAAPVFKKIVEEVLTYMKVKPDKPKRQ